MRAHRNLSSRQPFRTKTVGAVLASGVSKGEQGEVSSWVALVRDVDERGDIPYFFIQHQGDGYTDDERVRHAVSMV